MENIISFFTQNYIWFIVIIAIILLAIIGYYADKTNFGQGYNSDKSEEEDQELLDLTNVKLSTLLGNDPNLSNDVLENKISDNEQSEQNNINNVETKDINSNQSIIKLDSKIFENENNNIEPQSKQMELEFEIFDKQFDEIIPKKTIVDEFLLEDIESLSLDKTQKIDLSDIPDVDDIDLPKIKSMEKIDEDIWKF